MRLAGKDEFVINRPLQLRYGDLGFHGRFGGFERGEGGEQTVYVGDGEERPNAIAQTSDAEGAAIALTGGERANHATQASGVHISHAGDIQNDGLAGFFAHDLLEVEEGLDG